MRLFGSQLGWRKPISQRLPLLPHKPAFCTAGPRRRDSKPHLGELPGVGAAEESGAGAEADGPPAAEDVLRDRPVQGQHGQLVTYFH